MDIRRFFDDFGVVHLSSGHKHCRPGWVNTPCLFCSGHDGYHLGYEANLEYFYCWRCGHHSLSSTVKEITGLPWKDITPLISQYGGRTKVEETRYREKEQFQFPSLTSDLTQRHKNYIMRRGFDPIELENLFALKSTGVVSTLDAISFANRILMPIHWDQNVVSFTSRAANSKSDLKYLSCPLHRERIRHQSILYSAPHLLRNVGIVVEGPTDVWRFKHSTVATFGIDYTKEQVKSIARLFDAVYIVYDNETQAQKAARKLRSDLRDQYVTAEIVNIKGDPGAMKQKKADKLVKSLLQ